MLPEEGDTTDATASGGVDPAATGFESGGVDPAARPETAAPLAEAERAVEKAEQEDTAAVEMRAESLFQERLESHIHAIQTAAGEEEEEKAKKLGMKQLSEAELLEMLEASGI